MIRTSDSVWIVDYYRSAFSKAHPFKKEVDAYADISAQDILAQLINHTLDNGSYPSSSISELFIGCAFPVKEQWSFGARYPVMLSRLPYSCASRQVEQQCASGMAAVIEGTQAVMAGGSDTVFCGGYEHMSRIPMGPKLFDEGVLTVPEGSSVHKAHPDTTMDIAMNMGLTAEAVAVEFDISREEMDRYAYRSHQRAAQAQSEGLFADSIVPIFNNSGEPLLDSDVNIRAQSSIEKLQSLRPAFSDEGRVTAGNSSPLTSGAALLTLMSDQACRDHNLDPVVRILTACSVGVDPERMGYGVIPAIEKLLAIAKLDKHQVDLWEINEAFAVVPLIAIKHFVLDEHCVNVHGGAIAIGHPLGASGTRIVGQLSQLLTTMDKQYGVAALCVGGGQGVAMLLENTRASTPLAHS